MCNFFIKKDNAFEMCGRVSHHIVEKDWWVLDLVFSMAILMGSATSIQMDAVMSILWEFWLELSWELVVLDAMM
jgi:hypothetical protein